MWIEGEHGLINMGQIDQVFAMEGVKSVALLASYYDGEERPHLPVVDTYTTKQEADEARQWLFLLLSGWIDYEIWRAGRKLERADRVALVEMALVTNTAQMKAFPAGSVPHSRIVVSSIGLGIATEALQEWEA